MNNEKQQYVDRILYKFDLYSPWFKSYGLLMNADNSDISDLIGFCLDVQESLEAIIRENKKEEA